MSAYLVDPEHINVMIWAGLMPDRVNGPMRWYYGPGSNQQSMLSAETADRVGQMLVDVNSASVNYRYKEDNAYIYSYTPPRFKTWQAIEIIGAIHCYEYQACERDDWRESEAYAFCRMLERKMIRRLPDYDKAPWEITRDHLPISETKALELRQKRKGIS